MRKFTFFVVFCLFVYPFAVFGEESSVEMGAVGSEVVLEDVVLKEDPEKLLENLVKEGHLKLDRGEKRENVLITKGSKRFWTELGIGAGFYVSSALVAGMLMLYPAAVKNNNEVAVGILSPLALMMTAAASGAGVHVGGYLMDNMGKSWVPYVGAMAGGALSVSIELVGHACGNDADLWAYRVIAYISSMLFSVGGALIGAELSHKFEYEKKIRDSYIVLPALSFGKDYQSFGLQMKF